MPTSSEALSRAIADVNRLADSSQHALAKLGELLASATVVKAHRTWIDRDAALHAFPEQIALRKAGAPLFAPATDEDADKLARLFGVLAAAGAALNADDLESPVLRDVVAALAQAGFGEKPGHR